MAEARVTGVRPQKIEINIHEGTLRRVINIYLNEEDIRFLNGEETMVKDGQEVSVIHAIAGGRERG